MNQRILVNGAPTYLHGANYPWMVKDGKNNYGLDFGVNTFGTHEGVTTNQAQVEKDFALMKSLGFNTLRWFVFTDGRGGICYDDRSVPISLSDKFSDDMDCALTIAAAHEIKIIFVLLDHLWLSRSSQRSGVLLSADKRNALLNNIFTPVFQRYADTESLLAWEIMNEPDWILEDFTGTGESPFQKVSLSDFKELSKQVVMRVRAVSDKYVTVGNAKIRTARVWDDDELDLDFLQVHSYNDILRNEWDHIMYDRDCSEMRLTRPLVIGEFSTNAHLAFDSKNAALISLHDYLDFSFRRGYAGALYWSFNAVDKCGCESITELQSWKEKSFLA